MALARDTRNFPDVRLPPLWGEADRLVKYWRNEGRNIMRLKELVDGLEKSVADSGRASSHTWEDCRKTVVYTVRDVKCLSLRCARSLRPAEGACAIRKN